jgi:hypothetical protein
MTVASCKHGENPRYDRMSYAELRNELDKRDKLIKDMWPFILRSSISHYELDELEDRLFDQGLEVW